MTKVAMNGAAAILTLCLTDPASAQFIYQSDGADWRILESEEIFETFNWPEIRDDILARWGRDSLVELPFDQQGPVGTPALPEAYMATIPAAQVIHLEHGPVDAAAWTILASLFPDLNEADLGAFQDGVRIEAIRLPNGSHEVGVMFLDRFIAPTWEAIGPQSIIQEIAAALLTEMAQEKGTPDFGQSNSTLFLEGNNDTAEEIVTTILQSHSFRTEVLPSRLGETQYMASDGQEFAIIVITSSSPGRVQVLLATP